MGYGQGPGQANNIGTVYENLGFAGGRSFGLSLAAAGYLSACVVGVIYLNVLWRKGKFKKAAVDEESGSVTVNTFQDRDEIPISESVDKLSIQMGLVLAVYLISYFAIVGITRLTGGLGEGISKTVSTLLWGFNFMVGSCIAMLIRLLLKSLRKTKLMTRQYQNNYLLSRISGFAFDLMIIAGIGLIDIGDIKGLWLPFILMAVAGAIVTLFYLRWLCKKVYPNYYYEGMLSMYGMMTGTISSGILLLREIDPMYKTPAANNLVSGSGMAVLFGAPMLVLIGLAPKSDKMTWLVLGLLVIYTALLLAFMLMVKPRRRE
jgi:ESS family glutamate:Na+ symporter